MGPMSSQGSLKVRAAEESEGGVLALLIGSIVANEVYPRRDYC